MMPAHSPLGRSRRAGPHQPPRTGDTGAPIGGGEPDGVVVAGPLSCVRKPVRKSSLSSSPIAPQLSHFGQRPKKEGAPGAPSPNLELLDGPPADEQVVNDADDRQDQQQVDEASGDVQREAQ